MPKIIISYRRSDSDAIAGRIRDKLASYYGEDSVFMDIDNIPFGIDFRDHIRDALFENDILVVVVGPRWVGQGKGGHLRIQEENDPVRIEVETALERGIPVIPVLVNDAAMPKPSELPDSLRNFAYRNAAEVDAGRDFHQHMDRLIRSMDKVLVSKGKAPPQAATEAAPPPPAPGPPPAFEPPPLPVPPVTPRVEAPPIAAASEPEVVAKPVPRPDPAPPPSSASMPYSPPPGATAPPGGTASPPSKPPRLGLIVALVAAGSAVLAALVVGGTMYMMRPAPVPTPPQVVVPQPPPVPPAVTAGLCKSDTTPAFQDDFKTQDPGWGLTDKNETFYADGQLAIKAEANTSWSVIYRSLLYTNASVCLDLKSPTSVKDMERPTGGIIFWAVDYRTYYVALVYPDGGTLISRKVGGNWVTVAPRRKNDAVKPGLGVVNQIRVTMIGNVATVLINGRKIMDLKGQPPAAGGAVGIFGESEKGQVNEWRYLDVMIVELPQTQKPPPLGPAEGTVKALLAACKMGPTAALADDFKTADTTWVGVPGEIATLADGQLRIKAAVNSSWRTAYWSLMFKDITMCVNVVSPTNIKGADDTSGGVTFWGTDFDNYYSVSIFPDGSYTIDRRVRGSIVKVAPKAAHASIKKGPAAENRVKIAISGSTGTLTINDVKVQDFRGQPPAGGSLIGLFGESETDQRDEWGFSGIVVAETGP
jgi:TIR domain